MIRSSSTVSASPCVDSTCVGCGSEVADNRCPLCGAAIRAGRFLIRSILRETPRGRMYIAEDSNGARVALKELVFATVPSVETVRAFEREGELLLQLSHPRIPRFVDAFQVGQGVGLRLYLAQEYVPGASLADELPRRRFDLEDAKRIARQVLEVLAYLHGLSPRVIHRDIKPANLVWRTPDELVLVDFDAAREVSPEGTHRATLVGTFGYMPPEQLGGTVDATADLYALGATLLHLLTRQPPAELLTSDLTLDPGRTLNVPPRFRDWLLTLVSRDPRKRYASAQAARRSLDSTIEENAPSSSSSGGEARVLLSVAPAISSMGLTPLRAEPTSPSC